MWSLTVVGFFDLFQEVQVLMFYMAFAKLMKSSLTNVNHLNLFLSAIKTPSYNLAKFLVPLIESITKNNFTIKSSFEFFKEICGQNPEYFMASLDVDSLFTNIPLEETIKICCDLLYKNQEFLSNISKNQFQKTFKSCALQQLFCV